MPYAFGTQNAPAVGNGLGGLPRRATSGAVTSINRTFANTPVIGQLALRNTTTGDVYSMGQPGAQLITTVTLGLINPTDSAVCANGNIAVVGGNANNPTLVIYDSTGATVLAATQLVAASASPLIRVMVDPTDDTIVVIAIAGSTMYAWRRSNTGAVVTATTTVSLPQTPVSGGSYHEVSMCDDGFIAVGYINTANYPTIVVLNRSFVSQGAVTSSTMNTGYGIDIAASGTGTGRFVALTSLWSSNNTSASVLWWPTGNQTNQGYSSAYGNTAGTFADGTIATGFTDYNALKLTLWNTTGTPISTTNQDSGQQGYLPLPGITSAGDGLVRMCGTRDNRLVVIYTRSSQTYLSIWNKDGTPSVPERLISTGQQLRLISPSCSKSNDLMSVTCRDSAGNKYLQIYQLPDASSTSFRLAPNALTKFAGLSESSGWYTSVAVSDNGNVAVAYTGGYDGTSEGYGRELRFFIYDKNGQFLCGPVVGSAEAANTYVFVVSAAFLSTGDLVVAWQTSSQAVRFARFNQSGVLQGSITTIATALGSQSPNISIAANGLGNFIIAWWEYTNTRTSWAIYNSSGASVNSGVTGTVNSCTGVNAACDRTTDNFMVAWVDNNPNLTVRRLVVSSTGTTVASIANIFSISGFTGGGLAACGLVGGGFGLVYTYGTTGANTGYTRLTSLGAVSGTANQVILNTSYYSPGILTMAGVDSNRFMLSLVESVGTCCFTMHDIATGALLSNPGTFSGGTSFANSRQYATPSIAANGAGLTYAVANTTRDSSIFNLVPSITAGTYVVDGVVANANGSVLIDGSQNATRDNAFLFDHRANGGRSVAQVNGKTVVAS